MGDSLTPNLSGTGEGSLAPSSGEVPSPVAHPKKAHLKKSQHLLRVLRESLADSSQPPAAIMQAAAELARFLTGAEGVALALRTKGEMVCRARSGDPAPELGAPVNVDSGITGECVRTGSTLVCNDTASDPRVDPEVCHALGIRSIAAVPVRLSAEIAGILEGFSTRAHAFGEEETNTLRGLAEIAQTAYEREIRALVGEASPPVAAVTEKASPETSELKPEFKPELKNELQKTPAARAVFAKVLAARRYWVPAISVAALILVVGVWLSRRPVAETAAKEPAPTPMASVSSQPSTPAPALPVRVSSVVSKAGTKRAEREPEAPHAPLTNAAKIEPDHPGPEGRASIPVPRPAVGTNNDSNVENAPAITIESSDGRNLIANLGNAPSVVPTLGVVTSQGVTGGELIHKVNPAYPPLALNQRIQGSVTLEITIAKDGAIREVNRISGPHVLADAASSAIRQWRYSPFQLNGKPVELHEQVTVVFRLPQTH